MNKKVTSKNKKKNVEIEKNLNDLTREAKLISMSMNISKAWTVNLMNKYSILNGAK